jgi:hypothetical protein
MILCKTLSTEAAQLLSGVNINLSESSSVLSPFYIAANRGDGGYDRASESSIRDAFNGAVYPSAKITISPLQENAALWESFVYADDPPTLAKWRQLIDWFFSKDELKSPSFVEIGDGDTMSEVNFGCVFPRLVVAVTASGSLVGLCGHAVHT